MRFPPPLKAGDHVVVVAPSSPFDVAELEQGVAWLRERYSVTVGEGVRARTGYLAGDDARRAAELLAAMSDPSVSAILAARGGYGAMRIVDQLPWREWEKHASWLVGFSDITALHVEAQARGIASVHAPNVTGLGRCTHPGLRASWQDVLERPAARRTWDGLTVLHEGRGGASGVVAGGNLALLEAMAAAGRQVVPEGAVLVLEDVTERPYRIDRMLTSLLLGGHLARASAIVFGDFEKCEPGADGVRVEDVLAERTASLGVPVLAGAPFGHAARNDAFVLGARAEVGRGTLTTSVAEVARR